MPWGKIPASWSRSAQSLPAAMDVGASSQPRPWCFGWRGWAPLPSGGWTGLKPLLARCGCLGDIGSERRLRQADRSPLRTSTLDRPDLGWCCHGLTGAIFLKQKRLARRFEADHLAAAQEQPLFAATQPQGDDRRPNANRASVARLKSDAWLPW